MLDQREAIIRLQRALSLQEAQLAKYDDILSKVSEEQLIKWAVETE
jgi:hypothetical protein